MMEDAATAEISRSQLWQWVHHHAVLQDPDHAGTPVTAELCDEVIDAELARAKEAYPPARFAAYEHAAFLTRELIKAPHFQDFLTLPAYARVLDHEVYAA
jgi:malate synthase